jgi:hypothetical protein
MYASTLLAMVVKSTRPVHARSMASWPVLHRTEEDEVVTEKACSLLVQLDSSTASTQTQRLQVSRSAQ